MPKPYVKTPSFRTYAELSDEAKEKAREWYRGDDCGLDYDWWDSVYDDAKTIGKLMGIEIEDISFSGFWSQGDCANFKGSYAYVKGSAKAVRDYAPLDEELHRIAFELVCIQHRHCQRVTACIRQTGNYRNEYCTDIYVKYCNTDDQKKVAELLRDMMRWIYRTLEKEHDYLTSDEQVAETIECNEYEFTEEGKRA